MYRIKKMIKKNLRKILILLGQAFFWGGAWQLDLLAAPAFWHLAYFTEKFNEPFLLPFNIPIPKQIAYCLFFIWMFIGFFLTIFALWLLPEIEMRRKKKCELTGN